MKEIIIEKDQITTLTIVSNKIKSIFNHNSTKTACRVYKNGKIGIAGFIGETNTKELYSKAEQNLEYQIDYPVEPTKNVESHIKNDICKITKNEFYTEFEKILRKLATLHPDFAINNEVGICQEEYSMNNELGMNLSYFDRIIRIILLIKSKSLSDDIEASFLLLSRELESEKIIKSISEIITAYSNLIPLPKEPLPIIIDSNYINKIFRKELAADVLGTGSSLFQNQLDKEIFSKDFSLKIDNNSLETFYKNYDMEGTIIPEHLSYLIKNGTIIRPYSDKRTSKLYGYENTGCACGDFDSVPFLDSRDLQTQPGNKSIKELLNGQMGIAVIRAIGGDFTPDGVYASPVQLSFLTDGEKLLGRLPKFVIKSSIYDILGKNFIGMSSDKLYINCNKNMLVTKMPIEPL